MENLHPERRHMVEMHVRGYFEMHWNSDDSLIVKDRVSGMTR